MVQGFVSAFLLERFDEPQPICPLHVALWKLACDPWPYVAGAAPRGHAKSTSLNHGYGLAAALCKTHPFQLKISKTYDLACEKLTQAKEELIGNERIRQTWRLKRFEREREDDFIAELADGYQFRMCALGMGQATRGFTWGTRRPGLVIGDDMEDDEEVMNPDRRATAMRGLFK